MEARLVLCPAVSAVTLAKCSAIKRSAEDEINKE